MPEQLPDFVQLIMQLLMQFLMQHLRLSGNQLRRQRQHLPDCQLYTGCQYQRNISRQGIEVQKNVVTFVSSLS